jgi:hypothetical protein
MTTGEIRLPKGIAMKVAAIMGELEKIPANGTVGEGKYAYQYPTDADVNDAIRPLLAKHKLAILPSIVSSTRADYLTKNKTPGLHAFVKMELALIDGDTGDQAICLWEGESMNTSDKGTAQAATLAEKNFLMRLFKVSSGSTHDPDGRTPEAGSRTRRQGSAPPKVSQGVREVLKLCKDHPDGEQAAWAVLRERFGTPMVKDLTEEQLRDAFKLLKKTIDEFEARTGQDTERQDADQADEDPADASFIEDLDADG